MEGAWIISVFCQTKEQGVVAKAAEVMARAVAGLALEGIQCSLHVGPDTEEEE